MEFFRRIDRRVYYALAAAGLLVVGGWAAWKYLPKARTASAQVHRCVVVCFDDRGFYSPGIYLDGRHGGGDACLDMIAGAAPYMRAGDVGDAAAGLCGYFFRRLGDKSAATGGLSIYDSPRAGPNGRIDWYSYCSPDVDLILVNLSRGTADCWATAPNSSNPVKTRVRGLKDLKFER